jgi:iron-only hydrogenase maturation rSAM protein HydE
MKKYDKIDLTKKDLIHLLSIKDEKELESVRQMAENTLLNNCGNKVYYRGLIEFSNECACDCHYCGIRASNTKINHYRLSLGEIVESAVWCAQQGYGSVVLQSGERRDRAFVDFVESAVRAIKDATISPKLPSGLGITLCVGEQTAEVYRRFFEAGSHRYLLRIETTNPKMFARCHPSRQLFDDRVAALHRLKQVGFQVGTGVMIGLPGHTIEDLADDLLFFKTMDVDMIGMGPYIVHNDTPMATWPDVFDRTPQERLGLALRMIAAARLLLKDVNIAATTALQAIDPIGREQGLRFGANIIMPQLTPQGVRKEYLLYEGKPCLDESAQQCKGCLEMRIASADRKIGYDEWGDSKHFHR